VTSLALGLIALPISTFPIGFEPARSLNTAFTIQSIPAPKIQFPVEFTYMSQGFSTFHPGLDLATKYGTKINPIESGTVKMAGYSPFGYGFEIVIEHEDGMESLYAHLSKIEVKKGDIVNLNTEIGLIGSTGHSTGPHLHLEIHKNGAAINPLSVITLQGQASLTLNPR
jgi:murein DD-endopeptidase MepM/ murein hydrolase activator NlpD